MRKLLFVLLWVPFCAFGQVSDDFTDGDFTASPVWSGEAADFQVNTGELQLFNSVTDDSHLMTASTLVDNTTWEFLFRWTGFAGTGLSGSNEVFFYLVADGNVAPETTDIEGYFVRIGNTQDEISLYRQNTDISGSGVVELIDGNGNSFGGVTAASSGSIRIQVTRDGAGLWTLFADTSGGTTFVEIGSVTDATYTSGTHAGIFIDYSSGNADGYFFDDISIASSAVPIAVSTVVPESSTSLRVTFNQDVDQTTAEEDTNYTIDNGVTVTDAVRDVTNLDEVVLTVSTMLSNTYELTVDNVEDDATNTALAAADVTSFDYTQLAFVSLVTNSATEIVLTFNDDVDETTGETLTNYSIDNTIGNPSTVVRDGTDNKVVTLTLSNSLIALTNYTLTYGNLDNEGQNSSIAGGETEMFTFTIPLVVENVTVLSYSQIELDFNLDLDQTTAETEANYSIDNSIGVPTLATRDGADFSKLVLDLGTDLAAQNYTITLNNVEDAFNNAIAPSSEAMFSFTPLLISAVDVVSATEIKLTYNQDVEEVSAELTTNYAVDNGITVSSAIRDLTNADEVTLTLSALPSNTYEVTVSNVEDVTNGIPLNSPITSAFVYSQLSLNTLTVNSDTEILLSFNNDVDQTTAEITANYSINEGIGAPTTAVRSGSSNNEVTLTLGASLEPLTNYTLTYGGINNTSGNSTITGGTTEEFDYVVPLTIDQITVLSKSTIQIEFNLDLDETTAETITNYSVDNSLGNPSTAVLDGTDQNLVVLTFGSDLTENNFTITLNNVEDAFNNPIAGGTTAMFSYLPLAVTDIVVNSTTELALTFNQDVDETTAETLANYSVDFEIGGVTVAERDDSENNKVVLTLGTELVNNDYTLTINSVTNNGENARADMLAVAFEASFASSYRGIVINEIFPDPSPVIGLPGEEFIELYNTTSKTINIEGFDLTGGTITDFSLAPNGYVILTKTTTVTDFDSFGDAVGVTSWNSLTNSGEQIVLRDNLGNLIDSLTYAISWYNDEAKEDGGYSLEQINPELLCSYEGNWSASNDASGGTPGEENSIFDNSPDISGPNLISVRALDDNTIRLSFDEPMDEASLTSGNYTLDNGLTVSATSPVSPGFFIVDLDLNSSLVSGVTYLITTTGVTDCAGNAIATNTIELEYDIEAPIIDRFVIVSQGQVDVIFDEELDEGIAETEANYVVDNGIGSPSSAILVGGNTVELKFDDAFTLDVSNTLSLENIADTDGNAIIGILDGEFTYAQTIDSIIVKGIHQLEVIFAVAPLSSTVEATTNFSVDDGVGNPALAFVDDDDPTMIHLVFTNNFDDNKSLTLTTQNIKNGSDEFIATPEISFIYDTSPPKLQELTVLTSTTLQLTFLEQVQKVSAESLENYFYDNGTPTAAVLDVDGVTLTLTFTEDFEGETFFTLNIDNVKDLSGNPITTNIREDFIYDEFPPVLDSLIVISSTELSLLFNEDLETTSAETIGNYTVNESVGSPSSAALNEEFNNEVILTFTPNLPASSDFSISIENLIDTRSNTLTEAINRPFDFSELTLGKIEPLSTTQLQLTYNKTPEGTGVIDINNYTVNGVTPTLVEVDGSNDRVYTLTLSNNFIDDSDNEMTLTNAITGASGETLSQTSFSFGFDSKFRSVLVSASNGLELEFESNIDDTNSLTMSNFTLLPDLGNPIIVIRDSDDQNILRLSFNDDLLTDIEYNLSWTNIQDEFSNDLASFSTTFTLDESAPSILLAEASADNEIKLVFSEGLNEASAEVVENYMVDNAVGLPVSVVYNDSDSSVVLTFSSALIDAQSYTVTVDKVKDVGGNATDDATIAFTFNAPYVPVAGELLFTEIMADPDPVIGLPSVEYLEIYNNANQSINLNQVTLSDRSSSTILPSYDLPSGAYALLTSTSNTDEFTGVTHLLGVTSFPSLGNDGDSLVLSLEDNTLLDQVEYDESWYRDQVKADGGYGLELISFTDKCIDELNWIASTDSNGGTPGSENSVLDEDFDTESPEVSSISISSTNEITIKFSEPLDSTILVNATYTFSNSLVADDITATAQGVDSLQITFTEDLTSGILYSVTISGIQDCSDNTIVETTFNFGIGDAPGAGDLLITEIMADPSPSQGLPEEEFIEIYNSSGSLLDLEGVILSDPGVSSTFGTQLLTSGSYLILSASSNISSFEGFGEVVGFSSFPSLGNSEDSLSLSLADGTTIDVVEYENWYRNEDKDDGGYTLERISFTDKCIDELNWIASADANGGTPGSENSVLDEDFDTESPEVNSISISSTNEVTIKFSEPLDSTILVNATYTFSNSLITDDITATAQGVDSLQITFTEDLTTGILYSVTISGVQDCSDNTIVETAFNFGIGDTPGADDLLITEIMADPSPSQGLPEEEFIEIYNNSGSLLDLEGVILSDPGVSSTFGTQLLTSGSYLIVSASSNTSSFEGFGEVVGFSSFPSLGNSEDSLSLSLADGTTIDVVEYENWYRNEDKDDGGYTLERISFTDKCIDELNWIASADANGGTPGSENSVLDEDFDTESPEVSSISISSTNEITIKFSEPLDSTILVNATYTFSNSLVTDDITATAQGVDSLQITFTEDLTTGILYSVTISGVQDCSDNMIVETVFNFGIGETPGVDDLLITEIMADPSPSQGLPEEEFIEVYNNSGSLLDLEGVILSDPGVSSTFGTQLLTSGSYLILSSSSNVSSFEGFGEVVGFSSFPSLGNTEDSLSLSLADGTTIDVVEYENWYRDEDKDDGGYTLELISFTDKCIDELNWIASTDVNGGTPGSENSVLDEDFDTESPEVNSISITSTNEITIKFSEPLDSTILVNATYTFSNSLITDDITATAQGVDSLQITFTEDLTTGILYSVTISGVQDCSDNTIVETAFNFGIGDTPGVDDLLITEIMADPSPSQGLPEEEFIEIYNNSGSLLDLEGVILSDPGVSSTFGTQLLTSGSYLIVSASSNTSSFEGFGEVVGFSSFPSLGNSEDSLSLSLADGTTIDVVEYENWYRNEDKDDGGYTLERISFTDKCIDELNWIASADANGGTPGSENSVLDEDFDTESPEVSSISISSTNEITIKFSEPLDSTILVNATYTFSNSLITDDITASAQGADSLQITFTEDLTTGILYSVTISGIQDCSDNTIQEAIFNFGIGGTPGVDDLLITEIMADPSPSQGLPEEEFIEIYNNSGSLLDLEGVILSDPGVSSTFGTQLLTSGSYLILSASSNTSSFEGFGEVVGFSSFPSLGNSEDSLSLSLTDGTTIDVVEYENWYRDVEKDDGGYTLERISFTDKCIDELNWIASADANGATPGSENSVLDEDFDTESPAVSSISISSTNEITIKFSEPLDSTVLVNATYTFSNSLVTDDITATAQGVDSLQITFTEDLSSGILYSVTISGVQDCSDNTIEEAIFNFGIGETPGVDDLLITEIMADPSPSQGLPEEEFIEIYNNSGSLLDLEGVILSDPGISSTFGTQLLTSGSYLILSSSSNASSFEGFGEVVAFSSFPSLGNSEDSLSLSLADGTTIDVVEYENWYRNEDKDDGGYTLERISFTDKCIDELNWIASTDTNGGTPGTVNSVLDEDFDTAAPEISSISISSTNEITIKFSEPLDSTILVNATYTFSNSLVTDDITATAQGVDSLQITFTEDLTSGTLYSVTISGVQDCSDNTIVEMAFNFGIGETPGVDDLLITEIMADPSPSQGLPEEEFIEIYNNSGSLLDLEGVILSDPGVSSTFGTQLLTSGSYLILSSSSNTSSFEGFGEVVGFSNFPSLGNTEDSLSLSLADGTTIDVVEYENWYRDGSKDDGGYTLELISFTDKCVDELNWIASTDANGGTPGAVNSVLDEDFDTESPGVSSISISSTNEITIKFSEPLDSTILVNATYTFSNSLVTDDITATVQGVDSLQITFTEDLTTGILYSVTISGVQDCSDNTIEETTFNFGIGETPGVDDLLITEIMADPSPTQGLPEEEFIEIYNNSGSLLDLEGVILSDPGVSSTFGTQLLTSGSYLILSSSSNTSSFEGFGEVVGFSSFPSLGNSEDSLSLSLADGTTIDVVEYENWYRDGVKDDGGYTLELISFTEKCVDELNWIASADANGGTPGAVNSVLDEDFDTESPGVSSISISSTNEITIKFSEALDSTILVNATYTFSNSLVTDDITATAQGVDSLQITFTEDLTTGILYSVTVSGVQDCSDNTIVETTFNFGIGETPSVEDLLITEIMADPSPSQGLPEEEFIEIYNNSGSLLDLEGVILSDPGLSSTFGTQLLTSGSYLILSSSSNASSFEGFGEVVGFSSFPSLGNSEDSLSLSLIDGTTIDVVEYENWYRDGEKDDGGYTLERISFTDKCIDELNWIASADANGGTPGSENSVLDEDFDTESPEVSSISISSTNEITIKFSEPLDSTILVNATYTFSNSLVTDDITATAQGVDSLQITFTEDLTSGILYSVTVSGVQDCSDNTIVEMAFNFGIGDTPGVDDLLITEIMADPSPSQGLPEEEFIEIYNNSGSLLDLEGVILSDPGISSTFGTQLLTSGSYLILSSSSNASSFEGFGEVVGFSSFPSLGNSEDSLSLSLIDGTTIDVVEYENWYRDGEKDDGGYTLERISFTDKCIDELNWIASADANGGTPGSENSVLDEDFDTEPPEVSSISISSTNEITIKFSEPLDSTILVNATYTFSNSLVTDDITATAQGIDSLQITFTEDLTTGILYSVTVSGVQDCSDNTIVETAFNFGIGETPGVEDLLITEIMADPSPSQGLPEEEFIEIYNNSGSLLDLEGVILSDPGVSSTFGTQLLTSGSYLILSSSSNASSFEGFGEVVGFSSFPSLGNSEDSLSLSLIDGTTIDVVEYENWYRDGEKDDGGYTLERISFTDKCIDELNWIASADANGGTPGSENSVLDEDFDTEPPEVSSISITSTNEITIKFSEPLDSTILVNATYTFSNSLIADDIAATAQGVDSLQITFTEDLTTGILYSVTVSGVQDCSDNTIEETTFNFGIGETPGVDDLLITEIMADPSPSQGLPEEEFIEIYNNSGSLLDLEGVILSDPGVSSTFGTQLLTSGSYLILSSSSNTSSFEGFGEVVGFSSFPSLGNSEDSLSLSLADGTTIDVVEYENWYRDGVKDDGGYTLELISFTDKCVDELNWTASTDANGGTPGSENSVLDEDFDTESPEVISISITDTNEITIKFSEPLDSTILVNATYTFSNSLVTDDITATAQGVDSLQITFTEDLTSGILYSVTISGVQDCSDNTIEEAIFNFGIGDTPGVDDLLITEIMADPSPSQGLPEEEFIEIYNNSGSLLDLEGVILSDPGVSSTFGTQLLTSGSYLILSSSSNASSFEGFGEVVGFSSFPSLGNSEDSLSLSLADGTTIDVVEYENWYRDGVKDDGGYTLELISFTDKCVDELNWIASNDANGGTPGSENSVLDGNFDTAPPEISSISISSTNEITVKFSEPLDSTILVNATYSFSNSLVADDISVTAQGVDSLQIAFTEDLTSGILYSITVSGVQDCSDNTIEDTAFNFGIGETPGVDDLLITEIMADPSPSQGLPEEEFIEIYNNSGGLLDLEGVILSDRGSTAIFGSKLLTSGGYLILTSTNTKPEFEGFGEVLGLSSFPSLGNSEDSLSISLSDGTTIDVVEYRNWYRDGTKDDGGYALELISFEDKCVDELNWIASTHVNGGTPGSINSVIDQDFDEVSPALAGVSITNTNEITIKFSEPLDSTVLVNAAYSFSVSLTVDNITATAQGVDSLQITFTEALNAGVLYSVTISGIEDCFGNLMNETSAGFGIGAKPQVNDLLITEIMADPAPVQGLPEVEYLEIYNNTTTLLDLSSLRVSDASDTAVFQQAILGAGSYMILTATGDVDELTPFGNVQGLKSFPSLGNSKDSIVLSLNGTVLDQVEYLDDWYRDDLKKEGGFALERISFEETCVDELNWVGAESISGGTPGSENSVVDFPPDEISPSITQFELFDNQAIVLTFNEPMDSLSIVEGSYQLTNALAIDSFDGVVPGSKQVTLVLDQPLVDGLIYTLTITNLTDCAGNEMDLVSFEFGNGEVPTFNELLITEIMADPEPAVGLPSAEYLEIFNISDKNLELEGLILSDGSSETVLTSRILFPGEYAILTPNGSVSLFTGLKVIGVSNWPTLSNGGETISISNAEETIFSVTYSDEWYKDSEKEDGGFSLEMVDVLNSCAGITNWTSSISSLGGTPGLENSVTTSNPDNLGPQLLEAIAVDNTQVRLIFNEKLNPAELPNTSISISPTLGISDYDLVLPRGEDILLNLSEIMDARQPYEVSVSNITDCAGNLINDASNRATFILPEIAEPLDIILNEVLFNPRSGGVDFVEVYNNSDKAINLKNWSLADIDSDGEVDLKLITTDDLVIDPMAFLAFTTDRVILKADYPSGDETVFVEMSSFPSLPNDKGTVILMDDIEEPIDRFDYTDDYHLNLLDNVDGVSLERVNFEAETNDGNNWKSAASTVGFATPGFMNSQFSQQNQVTGTVEADPKVIVPDGTGVNDFTTINYDLQSAGNFANVVIYDQRGRLVKILADGDLLSTSGFFTWDGTDESGQRAAYGYYVIYFEVFDTSGKKEVMKETVVVGARF